jgi:cyclohexyl-isocyanide hydratase
LYCGLLLFPDLTQLDLTGPYEILPRAPDTQVVLVAKTLEPVEARWGMRIIPDVDFVSCPPLDLLLVPGGFGVNEAMLDDDTLRFIRNQAENARHIVSVCTGSLLLGAAGLLQGKRATTHWRFRSLLSRFGAIEVRERVVRDGSLFSGGGVTAGIDVALRVIADLHGEEVAQEVQLSVEYDPDPLFGCGTPEKAPTAVTARASQQSQTAYERTAKSVELAAKMAVCRH